MTPAARVQTAAECLDEILAGAPAEQVLTRWARASRFAGSKDRAAVRDHVYDVLRQKWRAASLGGGTSGRQLMIGLLRAKGVDPATLFTGAPYAPAPLEGAEMIFTAASDVPDLPDWIIPRLEAALGEDFAANAEAMRHRAPVFLRVNLRKTTPQKAAIALQKDGIETVTSPLAETALEVTEGARRVAQSAAYRDGLVELQDASSQAAIAALSLSDGARVLDYCAGGGGKTLAMAGRCQGMFFAHDIEPRRMRDLPDRAKRAGVTVACLEVPDVRAKAPYDLVFCDVPCSGSGTWRRTPDSKWRFSKADLAALLPVQAAILREAAGLVSEGGRLVYATCSLLPEENSAQVDAFLADHPDWQLDLSRHWTLADGCDGFFVAQLRRA
ncbi:RsmB/NOP family class I SAM-dependent RNA methyltransferase [Shimia sp. FJ5]|uniref:RsmB/NOP family class I SAM-dependent RNA methyltransferase n=1 Tax=Shimia sp. FJ5 TaxID=3079054 RepID=UPI002626E85A|nr:RsmB/NOP family class I SAM-dependent RNA methyltransferase [Shimia sp. FJ5]MDV4144197.1 RsmB/NOP family class I SAM-dependent RNA methyltransferase [Shimia sp. FJ5]